MRPDVISLRAFYRHPLGVVTADLIAARIRQFWSSLAGMHLAGIGFATPLLDRLGGNAASRVALMPEGQGVVRWSAGRGNATALVGEQDLPLPDGTFDRVILAHALEVAEHRRGLLSEARRVLAPGGRLITVVPRRRGLWSGMERTPFGSGQPFSRGQLEAVLADALLPVLGVVGALYLPPVRGLATPRALRIAERLASPWLGGVAGVLVVESEKQLYRPVPASAVRRLPARARPRPVPPLAPT